MILRSVSGISTEVVPGSFPFDIKVDGPFGAPAQNYKDYKIVVLIGAGIGVTPFASVLNDILDVMQNHKCPKCGAINLPKTLRIRKVYFYWTVRSRKEAAWFKHVLEAIGRHDDSDYIEMNIHITSFRRCVVLCAIFIGACRKCVSRADDLRMMLLRLAQYHGSEHGVDPLAGIRTRAVTNFGRPNWNIVFQKIKAAHKDETHHCGVFYCGPNSLRKVLSLSESEKDRF